MSGAMPCYSEIASSSCISWRLAQSAAYCVLLGRRITRVNTVVTAHAHDFLLFTVYQGYWWGLWLFDKNVSNFEIYDYYIDFLYSLLLLLLASLGLSTWGCMFWVSLRLPLSALQPLHLTSIVLSETLFSWLLSLAEVMSVIPWAY